MIKKAMLITLLALGFVLIFACKNTPKTDEAFKDAYDRHYNDLILDGAQTYTVVRGDMLARISRKFYNNGFYFPIIMLASRDIVLDPDKITPGMQLTIPDLQKNFADPKAKASIKNFLREIAVIEDERNRPLDAEGLRELADSL
jgi:hypothetical protein